MRIQAQSTIPEKFRKFFIWSIRQIGLSPRGVISKLPFVFIVGFNKCGTTALQRFFYLNGFPSIHWDNNQLGLRIIQNLVKKKRVLAGYDSRYRVFSDFMVSTEDLSIELNHLVSKFRSDYPNSYFILNTRPIDNWIASRASQKNRDTGERYIDIRATQLSTTTEEIASRWRVEWESHHRFVRRFFSGLNPNQLLVIDIEDDSTPVRIGEFLKFEPAEHSWQKISTN